MTIFTSRRTEITYSMYIQRVHRKVVGVFVDVLENLFESHFLSIFF